MTIWACKVRFYIQIELLFLFEEEITLQCALYAQQLQMKNSVILKKIRVLIERNQLHHHPLTLKICVEKDIARYSDFTWHEACRRWEYPGQVQVQFKHNNDIEIEFFTLSHGNLIKVQGEGAITYQQLRKPINRQIKVSLMYDGLLVGWMYCQLMWDKEKENTGQLLYLHKCIFSFPDVYEQTINFEITLNAEVIYTKEFQINQKSKKVFPNLKCQVVMSDVVGFKVVKQSVQTKHIAFLVDQVKRGRTDLLKTPIRSLNRQKIGELEFQYFLENVYLEDERKVFTRKALYPIIPENKIKRKGLLRIEDWQDQIDNTELKDSKMSKKLNLDKKGQNANTMQESIKCPKTPKSAGKYLEGKIELEPKLGQLEDHYP